MSRWLHATGACLLAGLLGGGACADRTSSTPSTPTTPTSPGTAVCAYVPDGAVPAVDAVGGAAAAAVRTAPACKWTAVTRSSIYLSVTASNHDPVARFGSVVVAGLSGVNPDAPVIVSQAASR